MSTSLLTAKTRIALPDSATLIKQAAAFYREHDCDVTGDGDQTRISVSIGHIQLSSTETALEVEVGAKTEVDVIQMKSAIISILQGLHPVLILTAAGRGLAKATANCPISAS